MVALPRTAAALCAGVLGLERGVKLVVPELRLVVAVERQAHAAAVLVARMVEGALDSAPVWDDLTTFDSRPFRGLVDLVAAGFPCQPASVAGDRDGVDDHRWLWPLVWRTTRELGAGHLFIENVPGLLSVSDGGAFEEILRDLAEGGWDAEWDCIPAAAVGAPHARDRLYLLASDAHRSGVRLVAKRDQRSRRRERAPERSDAQPDDNGAQRRIGGDPDADRVELSPRRAEAGVEAGGAESDRVGTSPANADGDAREPDRTVGGSGVVATSDGGSGGGPWRPPADSGGEGPQGIGVREPAADGAGPAAATPVIADSDSPGLGGERRGGQLGDARGRPTLRGDTDGRRRARSRHPQPGEDLSDSVRERLAALAAAGAERWAWDRAPQPIIRRVDDGDAGRVDNDGPVVVDIPGYGQLRIDLDEGYAPDHADRLHACGNGVVDLGAAYAWTVLWHRLHES